jgi:hypothetical protein
MNLRRPKSEEPLEEARFDWFVFGDGFKLEEKNFAGIRHMLLVPKNEGKPLSWYRPLEECKTLFDDFSRIDSPDKIVEFANRFGWLGLSFPSPGYRNRFDARRGVPDDDDALGEQITDWQTHINEMKVVLAVLDLVNANNSEGLSKFIQWDANGVIRLSCRINGDQVTGCKERPKWGPNRRPGDAWRQEVIVASHQGQQYLPLWKRGESLGPAKVFLSMTVDRALRNQVSPRLVLDPSGSLRPYIYPSSLLAAIWLQVYRHAICETKIRRCEICHARMDVTDNRTHKRVHENCSLRVRMQRYRSGGKNV